MSKNRYIAAVGSGMAGSAVNAVTSVVLIWLLQIALGKIGYGTIVLSIVVLEVTSAILASGFMSVVLYRVSRIDSNTVQGLTIARSMIGAALTSGFTLSVCVAIFVAVSATHLASLFGKPELAFWFLSMSAIIPLDVARRVLVQGCIAQQKVHLAVLYTDVIPGFLRVALVGLVILCDFSGEYVVAAYLFGQIVPALILLLHLQPTLQFKSHEFTEKDFFYGLKLTLNRLANEPSRSIDVLLVGGMTTAGITAEYALGSRISRLLITVKTAFERLLVPRLGSGMQSGNRSQIHKEYGVARFYSLLATIIGMTGICAVGPYILPLFGDYAGAFPVLLILGASMVVKVGVGSSGFFLNMAGYAGYTLLSTVLGMGVNVILALILIPNLLGVGSALSVLLGAFVIQAMIGVFLWAREKFTIIDISSGAVVISTTCLALIAAFADFHHLLIALAMALVCIAYFLSNKIYWAFLLAKQ